MHRRTHTKVGRTSKIGRQRIARCNAPGGVVLEETKGTAKGAGTAGVATGFWCETQWFRDADEHAEALRRWDQRYEQLSSGRFEGRISQTWLEGIQIFHETTREVVDQAGSAWPGAVTVGLVRASSDSASFVARSVAPGDGFIFGSPGEFCLRTARRFEVIGLSVPASMLNAFAQKSGDFQGRSWDSLQPAQLSRSEPLKVLHSLCGTYFDVVSQDRQAFSQQAARSSVRDQLLAALTDLRDAQTVDEPASGQRRKLVKEVERLVRERCSSPVTALELCQTLRVSRRTLQYSFQQELGVSPLQYLRAIRLNGVRRELKFSFPGARVWEVAARWGFWHQGQFARDYRAMFGELPSQTLRSGGPR